MLLIAILRLSFEKGSIHQYKMDLIDQENS